MKTIITTIKHTIDTIHADIKPAILAEKQEQDKLFL